MGTYRGFNHFNPFVNSFKNRLDNIGHHTICKQNYQEVEVKAAMNFEFFES